MVNEWSPGRPVWLRLSSKLSSVAPATPETASPSRWRLRSGALRLANSYHSIRIARLTLYSAVIFALLWCLAVDIVQLKSWFSLQAMTVILGLCALPQLRLFTVSDNGSGTTLTRSWLLRVSEVVVILQRLAWNLIVLFVILSLWMYTRLAVLLLASSTTAATRSASPSPSTTTETVAPSETDKEIEMPPTIVTVLSSVLGTAAIVLIFVQSKEFDCLRAHEQLQLGFGIDPMVQTSKALLVKSHKHSVSWIARPTKALRLGDLRRALYAAAIHSDVPRTQKLLDVVEKKLGSKEAVRRLLLKMYATPTLWLWWFAVSTLNPLHVACRQGDENLVRILLDAGMDPNALDKTHGERLSLRLVYDVSQGRLGNLVHVLGSPLHVAVASQHTDLIDVLVDAGADIDLVARSSFFSRSRRVSPVFVADSRDALERLISHGANFLLVPGTRDRMNVTVLQRVSLEERNDLAGVLRQWGGDVALTPLHAASAAGDAVTVRRFLSCGVPPDPLGEFLDGVNRRTPLHWASIMGRTLIVKLLIDYGADVDAMDADGRTPLHWAARHDHIETVAQLLEAGGDPSVTDSDGLTALAFGVAGGRVRGACVSLFAAAGVDINERQLNTAGDTCLHLALRAGHQLSALALVESGRADLRATNNEGEEAIDCCATATLQFAVKTRGGWTDVVVVHDASGDGGEHALLAKLVQRGIQENLLTAWMRKSDDEKELETSVRVMADASAVVCVLSPGFEHNAVCMEELAFAKERGVAVMAITTGSMDLSEELQVYLFTRQLVPFADVFDRSNASGSEADGRSSVEVTDSQMTNEVLRVDEDKFQARLQSLIDGLRDEVELDRVGSTRGGTSLPSYPRDQSLDEFMGVPSPALVSDLQEGPGHDSTHPWLFDVASRDSVSTTCTTEMPLLLRDSSALSLKTNPRSLHGAAAKLIHSRRLVSAFQQHRQRAAMALSVFVSHGDCHTDLANHIRYELELRFCNVTIDSMAKVSSMKQRIVTAKDAILQCDVFVVVLSEESVRTELVNDQLAFAEDKGKRIVPVYFSSAPSFVDGIIARLLEDNASSVFVLGSDLSYGRGVDDLRRELDNGSTFENTTHC